MSDPILSFFACSHLPEPLKSVSEPFHTAALKIDATLPDGTEKSKSLRQLLEIKDLLVRAVLLPVAEPPPVPVITSFTASAASVDAGALLTLSWETANATSVEITNDQDAEVLTGTPTGTLDRNPLVATVYTLKAIGEGGEVTATVSVAINVVVPPPAPVIVSFTASSPSVNPGDIMSLSWETTNATSIEITNDQDIEVLTGDPAAGSLYRYPSVETVFTLKAIGAGGEVTASVTVGMNVVVPPAPPVITSFTASVPTVDAGDLVTLSWVAAETTSVEITNDQDATVETGSATGTLDRNPLVTTVYTLKAIGPGGEVTATVTVGVNVAAPPPPPPPPPPAPPPAPEGGDIVDGSGNVVQSAYNAIAQDYTSPAALTYRYGEASATNDAPELTEAPIIGTITSGYGGGSLKYQFGGPENLNNNDYVTNQGAGLVAGATLTQSVVRLTTMSKDRHCITLHPQPFWQDGQDPVPSQLRQYIADGVLSESDKAVYAIRHAGPGDSGITRQSILATQGTATVGPLLFTIGTATAPGRCHVRLKPGVSVTSIDVSDNGEFAYATLWNFVEYKGEVAVIALASVRPGYTWQSAPPIEEWWNDWTCGAKPGIFNQGNIGFMKVVGYVALPSDMKAPTCCRVITGVDGHEQVVAQGSDPGGIAELGSPLANNLHKFQPGGIYHEKYTKGGLLVVGSYSEQKLAWIDLTPLIGYYNSMYFGNSTSNALTQALGMGDSQWPYFLSSGSAYLPQVIKTEDAGGHVRSIVSTISYGYWNKYDERRNPGTPYWMDSPNEARVWVVVKEGKIGIYKVGKWVMGVKPTRQGSPITEVPGAPIASEIEKISEMTGLGTNIVHAGNVKDYDIDMQGIAWDEADAKPHAMNHMLMLTDRAGRGIKFVQFDLTNGGTTGVVRRTLVDKDLDPMWAEMADSYDQKTGGVTIADGAGQAFKSYRIFAFSYDGTYYPVPAEGQRCGKFLVNGPALAYSMGNVP